MIEKDKYVFGISQFNPHAGAVEKNAKKIIEIIEHAKRNKVEVLFFSLNSLLGYKMEDTLKKFPFLYDKSLTELKKIAKHVEGIIVYTAYTEKSGKKKLAILSNGELIISSEKQDIIIHPSEQMLLCFCLNKLSECNTYDIHNLHPDMLISFDNIGIIQNELYTETEAMKNLANKFKIPVINISATGATDSYMLAGGSCTVNGKGKITHLAQQYQEDFIIFNPFEEANKNIEVKSVEIKNDFSMDYENDLQRTYNILVYGIKEYFAKCGIQRAVLGLSGGLDSTVCAVLLADAIGKKNVLGVSMPSKLTSKESLSDAKILAKNLEIKFVEMPIKPMYETTKECLDTLFSDIEKNWDMRYKNSYTSDNIQARSRAMYLWGISNEFSSCIPIATSDKSEAYMGYATINGDMSGGFAPILDITKTKLFALARWMNENRAEKNVIPQTIIDKKPGAELALDPKTGKTLNAEDALMPYEFMDEIIWRIEKKQETYEQILNSVFVYEKKYKISKVQKEEWLDKFYKRMSSALYKAYIMPPSVITEYPSNIKTAYYQPITSCGIVYKQNQNSK